MRKTILAISRSFGSSFSSEDDMHDDAASSLALGQGRGRRRRPAARKTGGVSLLSVGCSEEEDGEG
jgi:hypothetical protein